MRRVEDGRALDQCIGRGGKRAVKRGDRRVECWTRVMDKMEHVN